jgi:hypothetical protein
MISSSSKDPRRNPQRWDFQPFLYQANRYNKGNLVEAIVKTVAPLNAAREDDAMRGHQRGRPAHGRGASGVRPHLSKKPGPVVFEKGHFPLTGLGVVADNPQGRIGGSELKIAILRGKPAIDNFDNLHSAAADLNMARRFFTAIACITFYLNLHGVFAWVEAIDTAIRS